MRGVVALTQHANVHDNFFACGLDRGTNIEFLKSALVKLQQQAEINGNEGTDRINQVDIKANQIEQEKCANEK